MPKRNHPAPFHPAVLQTMRKWLDERIPLGQRAKTKVLDPFAGVGLIHEGLAEYQTIGVELEPEWAERHAQTEVGDALKLRWRRGTFAVIATSPCYGNRMADHHNARDDSRRHTYRHQLGRELSPGSAGALQWGEGYREFHERALFECTRVTKSDALFLLNMSDHWRDGYIEPVTAWWIRALTVHGWEWVQAQSIPTQRMRDGANAQLRAKAEWVLLFERRAA